MTLARTMTFRTDVRCGPEAQHRVSKIDITADFFGLRLEASRVERGHIDVDMSARIARIYNPSPDRATGEAIDSFVPLENVSHWEPLSIEQAGKAYGWEGDPKAKQPKRPVGFRAKPGPKPKDEA